VTVPEEPEWRSWKQIDWAHAGSPIGISDGVWPEVTWGKNNNQQAGPTGEPWVNSNGWLIRYARSRAGKREVWLKSDPPEKPETLEENAFRFAVIEAAAFGAVRPAWVPDDQNAPGRLRAIGADLQWLNTHPEWAQWDVPAQLVVISSFSGDEADFAGEVLNLSARLDLPVDVLGQKSLSIYRAALWLDSEADVAALRAFVQGGGLLICKHNALGGRLKPALHPRYDLFELGKGRVAVAKKEWDDPFVLAADAHLLLSRRWDDVRLFNASAIQFRFALREDGRRAVVQLLNYTLREAASPITLQLRRPARAARWHLLGQADAKALTLQQAGREWPLPPFPLYAAVELEYA